MSTIHSITELRKMSLAELRRDLHMQHAEAGRLRISIEMQSEKNHALYRRLKRDIARMTMVLRDMEKAAAKKPAHSPKDAAPKTSQKASQTKKKSVQGSRSQAKK